MDKEIMDTLSSIKPAPLPMYNKTLLPSFLPLRNGGMVQRIEDISNFEPRESDILICGFPKSGNHWIHEIVELLLNQKAELTETTLPGLMLEFCNLSLLQDFTCKTTRVLHTHLPYRFLSSSKLIGQCKTIVIVRNPKDTCVSYHNHSKKDIFINYDISWNEFFEKWMTEEIPYGYWYDCVQEFERAKDAGKQNILITHYEDIKQKPGCTIQSIAEFLRIAHNDQLIDDIIRVTSFDNMTSNKKELSKLFDPEGKGLIFRKGQISDWKNWFTVEQNERFDQQYATKMKNSKLTFTFE